MANNNLSIFSFLTTDFHNNQDNRKPYLLNCILITVVSNIIFLFISISIERNFAIFCLLLLGLSILSYWLIKIDRFALSVHLMSFGYTLAFIGTPWLIGRIYAPIFIYIPIILVANLMLNTLWIKILYFIGTFLSIYAYILASIYTTQAPLPYIELIELAMLPVSILFVINALNIFLKNINIHKKEIKKREYFLNKIIDTSPNAIFVKNNKRQFILVNDKFAEIEGKSKEAFIGKTAAELQNQLENDITASQEDDSIIKTRQAVPDRLITSIENEEQLWFVSSKFPITDDSGQVVGILGVSKNITQQKRQEIALNQKNIELEKYIASNMQLENFAHIASHDLREPIRSIVSFSQLLKRNAKNKLDDDESDYLNFIITASQNMATQIEDLLTYAIIETKQIKFKATNIPRLLEDIIRQEQDVIEEKNAQISYENMPDVLHVNDIQISQLFSHLITNALKFNRPNTPSIIKINGEEHKEHWQFSLSDNGIGIEPEYYEKIFLLFRRLHTREVYQGTGIGLSICKKILKQHKGKIWLTSKVGQGTTFYFTISKQLV